MDFFYVPKSIKTVSGSSRSLSLFVKCSTTEIVVSKTLTTGHCQKLCAGSGGKQTENSTNDRKCNETDWPDHGDRKEHRVQLEEKISLLMALVGGCDTIRTTTAAGGLCGARREEEGDDGGTKIETI